MTWRPEGWETVGIASRMWQGKPLRSTHDAFEAGADAMLETLSSEIEKVELSVSECEEAWREAERYWNLGCHEWTKKKAIAEAQLQKILAIFKEGQ